MNVPLQVLGDAGAQESEWLHCSHSAVHDGEWEESRVVSPEVHDPLHCFECVELQVVKTAPDSQLLNLLSGSRFVTVLDEADQCGVVCKLQELDRGTELQIIIIIIHNDAVLFNNLTTLQIVLFTILHGCKAALHTYVTLDQNKS